MNRIKQGGLIRHIQDTYRERSGGLLPPTALNGMLTQHSVEMDMNEDDYVTPKAVPLIAVHTEREAIELPRHMRRARARVRCTESIVEAWLALPRLNRHFDQSVADAYARAMIAGNWKEGNGDCLRFTTSGKLGDGQHRLDGARQALQHGVAITFDVEVAIDPEVVLSFDCGRRRLPRDVATMQGLAPWEAQKAAQAASLLYNHERRQSMWMTQAPSLFDIDAHLRTHPEIVRSASFMKGLNLRGVPYPYGLAVALHTLFSQRDPSLADAFFTKLYRFEDVNSREGVYWLRRHVDQLRHAGHPVRITYDLIARTINAWNAMRKGNRPARVSDIAPAAGETTLAKVI